MKSISRNPADADSGTSPVDRGLLPHEVAAMETDGFVVRHREFSGQEVSQIAEACEALTDEIVRDRVEHRFKVGSYVFDPDLLSGVIIKWEEDTDVVHGLEPFAHLSPALDRWAHDDRFLHPMRHFTGHPSPMLFTEKLNLKRAGAGGANPLHLDHPYWKPSTPRADDIATSMLFLDDADIDNGCLWVLPGSHVRRGAWPGRTDGDAFLENEIDPALEEQLPLVPLEVEAGSVVHFGAFLVHRSAPNRSDRDRRALLFSYQPPVEPCPTQLDLLRAMTRGAG